MKCNFIGIEVQKSASTWGYRIRYDHPGAVVNDLKELELFSQSYKKWGDWYHAHFNVKEEAIVAGEISTSYFYCYEAVIRTKKYNPILKIVITLRAPIKRAYSNHLHFIRISQYREKDKNFETGLKNYEMYIEQSKYYSYLKHWFDHFFSEQILVLIQENILKYPEESAKQLYDFLGASSAHKFMFLTRKVSVSYAEKHKELDEFTLKTIGVSLRKIGLTALVQKMCNHSYIAGFREKNRIYLSAVAPKIKSETELSDGIMVLAKFLHLESLPWQKVSKKQLGNKPS